jgi:hypothetical protein
MKKKLLLALIAASLLVPMISLAPSGTDSATTSGYSIQGYVAEADRTPMEGVVVTVIDGTGYTSQSETNDAGLFDVPVNANTGLQISFTVFGYTAVTCPNTTYQAESEFFLLNLSKAAYNNSTRTYFITDTSTDAQCVIMMPSAGIVRGYVSSEQSPVKNATVTLVPSSEVKTTYTAHTDNNGYYELTCPTGAYTLTVGGQGFDESEAYEVKVTGSPVTVNVIVEKSDVKRYLGVDTAHLLMLIGVIVGILLAVAAWILSRRMNRPHGVEIIDDSVEEEDEFKFT